MPLEYLKNHVPFNQPTTVVVKKIQDPKPELDYKTNTPTGRTQRPFIFDVNGTDVWHFAKENEQAQLEGANEGTEVRVIQQQVGKSRVMTFNVLNGSNGHSNGQETRENEPSKSINRNIEQQIRNVRIGLQGLVQSYISQGKNIDEALDLAEEGLIKIQKRATVIVRSQSSNGKR